MKKISIWLCAVCLSVMCGLCLCACADTEYSVACGECENGYVTVSAESARAGEKVIIAAHPRAGYKLIAFSLNGEKIDGVSFTMPQKDVTVSAAFEPITYSVTYVLGNATVEGSNPDTYTVESGTELISPQKEGYEICGWYRYNTEPEYFYDWGIEDFRVTSLDGLYGDITLYAHYYNTEHRIEITDDMHGDCTIKNYDGYAYYGDVIELEVQAYDGYELDFISVNGELIDGLSFVMPSCDVEISVEYKLIKYTITYELDGGANAPDNPGFYTVTDGYVYLGDATKEGYEFYGWYFDAEFTRPVEYSVLDAELMRDVVLYALFESENL